ncbi:hypothetical protein ACE6H2_022700 [Prunus campanulata]
MYQLMKPSPIRWALQIAHQESIQVYFRQSTCKAQNVHLCCSEGNTFFIQVVSMGVYYDISKFEPHWIHIETSGLPTPSLVQKNLLFPATKRKPTWVGSKRQPQLNTFEIPCEKSLRCSKRSTG